MKKHLTISAITIVCLLAIVSFKPLEEALSINKETNVANILIAYGEAPPDHYVKQPDEDKVRMGESIVLEGSAIGPDGKRSKLVSQYFVCTDCHNTVAEFEDPSITDPEKRLAYAKKNTIPFLPASTFFGITNRTSWFNDDYYKKYGDLVKPANNSLDEAIQLCSKECSSGRHLEDWELEAVKHYFTSLQLKLGDLSLSDGDWTKINNYKNDATYKKEVVDLLQSKYVQAYAATFIDPMPVDQRKMGEGGNVVHGKVIFEQSCLHCHAPDRVTETVFAPDEKDEEWLVSYFHKFNGGSIYNITRTGTETSRRTPEYMPIYPKEKLSNTQLEDLAAYLKQQASKKK